MKKAALLFFLFTFSQLSFANDFDKFLHHTTWCFEDTQGQFDHGRIRFLYQPWTYNWGFYDVTDAPAGGGTEIGWKTYSSFWGWRLVLGFPNGREMKAIVTFPNDDHMDWQFDGVFETSHLHRCE